MLTGGRTRDGLSHELLINIIPPPHSVGGIYRCNQRLQRLHKFLINAFVIFVYVYYFNNVT